MFSQTTTPSAVELESAIIQHPLVVSPETTVMAAIALMNHLHSRDDQSREGESQASQALAGNLQDLANQNLARQNLARQNLADSGVRSSCVLVIEDHQLIGIFTEQDVVRLIAQQRPLAHLSIRQVMTHPVVALREPTFADLFFAINLLQQYRISHLPILGKHDRLMGMVTDESLQKSSRPSELLRLCSVKDVMGTEVVYASPEQSLLAIAQQMVQHNARAVVLVESKGNETHAITIPVGIVTERDLMQIQATGTDLTHSQASTVMQTAIVTVAPTDSLWAVQQLMENHWIRQLVVVGEQGEPLGLVTQTNLLKALDPVYLCSLKNQIEDKVIRLEAEKVALLESRADELAQQVEIRTAALKAKAEREKLILELATQIRTSLSLQTILHTTVKEIRRVIGCDRVNIWQFDDNWQCTVIAESTDSPISLVGTCVHDSYFQDYVESYRQGHICLMSDVNQTHLANHHQDLMAQLQTRAKILVPLFCGEELWGLLNVAATCVRDWQPEDVELIQAISLQLAVALQQAITHQRLQTELNERKQAEARLRESERRYASLAAIAPVGIFRTDALGNCIYVNDRWCQMSGLTIEASMGSGWQNAVHPEEREHIIHTWERAVRNNHPCHLECRLQHPDGQIVWVYGESVIEQDGQGQILGCVGTVIDLTERKEAELALAQSEIQNRAILAAIPDLMFRVGADGIYRELVTQHQEIAIVESDLDFAGQSITDLLPKDLAERQLNYLQRALQTEELQVYEQRIQIRGRCQDEEVRVVKSGEDEVLFMIRDISERKRLEAERQQAEQRLQQLNQALEVKVEERTAALQERETRYRALMDGASDAILVADLQGNLLEANHQAEKLFGYSRDQLIQMHQSQLCSPEDMPQFNAAFSEVVQGIRHHMPHAWIMRPEGESVPIGISATRVKIGDTYIIQGIFRDITERLHAESALRESQQFLQTVLDTFPLYVFWKDRQSVYLGCNHGFAQAAGFESSAEIIGKTDDDIRRIAQSAQIQKAHDQRVMSSGVAQLGVVEAQEQSDGKSVWIEANKVPLRDLEGQVIGVLGTYQDITVRKQTELKLQRQAQQERLLASITQRVRSSLNLEDILKATVDELYQILQADRVLVYQVLPQGTGTTIAEAIMPGWPKLLDMAFPEEIFPRESYDRYVNGHIFTLRDRDAENHRLSPDWIDFLASIQVRAKLVVPIVQNQTLWGMLIAHQCDRPRQWQPWEISLLQQITNQLAIAIQQANLFEQLQQELSERQQAQKLLTTRNQQLAISNQELERATRLKDEFLANMSHELRTPLNAILGMTEGLQEEIFGTIQAQQAKALDTIARSGAHLLELINDILDVAKIESGQMELELASIPVAPLCRSSIAFVKQQALKKRLQLDLKLPSHLPKLWVDERRIRQVLINLLNNAVKFTPEGGGITLAVDYPCTFISSAACSPDAAKAPDAASELGSDGEDTQHYVRISVIDTGIGIAPGHIKKLFQPFIQIDSALNRQYAGTGLGLSLVKCIVELHGGHVALTSEMGVGSCFTIDLPCTDAISQPEQLESSVENQIPLNPLAVNSGPLILLAEDNEANIHTISSYLKAKGYQLLLARNGQEVITLTQTKQPDLILMDIQMPGMDGLEAMQYIRRTLTLGRLPIIALTALAMAGDRDRCLQAGADNYLSKPIKLKQLATMIQTLLSREP